MENITVQSTQATHFSAPASGHGRKLLSWSEQEATAFGVRPLSAKHQLHQLGLFSDAALLDLLENYPRDRLQAFTMGTDPLKWKEWQPVDTTGVSGKQLFEAVARGRLWFNILQVHIVDRRYRDVLEQLYTELSELCPHFRPFRKNATLLVSSPSAMVYYHADPQPNLLWQIRGSKRVWVYPAGVRILVSQDLMEDIFASVMDEEVPYKLDFDQRAVTFDLMPGDVLSWPHNAPHRVTNLTEVNVSLSTLHETEDSDRRKLIYCANRLFRRTYHLPMRTTKETGAIAYTKRIAYRGLRRAGLLKPQPRRAYVTNLRVDPNAPTGASSLANGPVLTEFSQKEFTLKKDASGQVSIVPK